MTDQTPTWAMRLAVIILLAPLLHGCASLKETEFGKITPGPKYDELYPYYVQLCAVSQIRAKFAEEGGSPGHAVMYVKGACRDTSVSYPRLRVCDPDKVDLNDPEVGFGVSVNKVMKNVNWMAIPGKRLFYAGNVPKDRVLDADTARATIQYAADHDVFAGIEIHEQYEPVRGDEWDMEYFLASETLGTDFALNFGRNVFCATLPVTRPMLEDIVGYLSSINDQYARGEADYNWSGYSDNCVHLVRNALAAADVWRHKSVNQIKLMQLFNLAIPSNEMANLAFRANTYLLGDFEMVYRDGAMRNALKKYNWLPTRHGALLEYLSAHENNELYDTRHRILVLEAPILRQKSRRIGKMYNEPRYTELAANLEFYKGRYEKILAKRPADWDQGGDDYSETRRLYYRYIEAQLADVNDKLRLLGVAPN